MACEELRAELNSLRQRKAKMEQDMDRLPEWKRPPLQQTLNRIEGQIQLVSAKLKSCLDALISPQRVAGAQPKQILEIRFQNPEFNDTGDWGTRIAGGKYPVHQGFERKPILDSNQEYDDVNLVGATGWAINPSISIAAFHSVRRRSNPRNMVNLDSTIESTTIMQP